MSAFPVVLSLLDSVTHQPQFGRDVTRFEDVVTAITRDRGVPHGVLWLDGAGDEQGRDLWFAGVRRDRLSDGGSYLLSSAHTTSDQHRPALMQVLAAWAEDATGDHTHESVNALLSKLDALVSG